jgi:hypothetical protein
VNPVFDSEDLALLSCLALEIPNFRLRLEAKGIDTSADVRAGIRIVETFFDALVQAGVNDPELRIVVGGRRKHLDDLRLRLHSPNLVEVIFSGEQLNSLLTVCSGVLDGLIEFNEVSIRTGFSSDAFVDFLGRLSSASA